MHVSNPEAFYSNNFHPYSSSPLKASASNRKEIVSGHTYLFTKPTNVGNGRTQNRNLGNCWLLGIAQKSERETESEMEIQHLLAGVNWIYPMISLSHQLAPIRREKKSKYMLT